MLDPQTPLDHAHAAMEAAPDDDAMRLRFFERLADAELFLLLAEEPEGDRVTPQTFDLGPQTVVLVFDREDRLTQFLGGVAPYAALSGRVVVDLLSREGLGLGLNLDVAPSSFLLDAQGVAWLAETLQNAPSETEQRLAEVSPPTALPESLLEALDAKLSTGSGLARYAYLVATRSDAGGVGHMLAFVDALPGAEPALAQAVGEVLTFSGIDAAQLDVAFFASDDRALQKIAQVGLRFDLPTPDPLQSGVRPAPGSDPDKPPILR